MIQDILSYRLHNEYKPEEPDEQSFLMIGDENQMLLRKDSNEICFPRYSELPDKRGNVIYLFSISEYCFFTNVGDSIDLKELFQYGYSFMDISVLMHSTPKWLCFGGITAYQLIRWYRKHQYCGVCGRKMTQDASERMLYCGHCGNHVYPQICPAVIVGVVNRDKILMSRYSDQRDGTRYALLAGFAEIGETIEETVQREVVEEVGLRVKNIQYYKSQPWSFSDTLLLGFFCELDGPESITLDTHELSVAEWVARKDMDIQDDDISLTYEMMAYFKENKIMEC